MSRLVRTRWKAGGCGRSEEHTSELQSPCNLVCRLLLEKKNGWWRRGRSALAVGAAPAVRGALLADAVARGARSAGECLLRRSGSGTLLFIFFFNDTATTEIYTLSLHDALPISLLNFLSAFAHPHGVGPADDLYPPPPAPGLRRLRSVLFLDVFEQPCLQLLNPPPQLRHVQGFVLRGESLARCRRDLARLQQALVRRLWFIIFAMDFAPHPQLLLELHGGLEEVLVQRKIRIQLAQNQQLPGRIHAPVSHHFPHMRPVPLFHPGVVVLLVRTS